MTLTETKTTDHASTVTPQQHHAKADEHLELAAKSHKEVVKMIDSKDHKGASDHTKVANAHVVSATEHVTAAAHKLSVVAK